MKGHRLDFRVDRFIDIQCCKFLSVLKLRKLRWLHIEEQLLWKYFIETNTRLEFDFKLLRHLEKLEKLEKQRWEAKLGIDNCCYVVKSTHTCQLTFLLLILKAKTRRTHEKRHSCYALNRASHFIDTTKNRNRRTTKSKPDIHKVSKKKLASVVILREILEVPRSIQLNPKKTPV